MNCKLDLENIGCDYETNKKKCYLVTDERSLNGSLFDYSRSSLLIDSNRDHCTASLWNKNNEHNFDSLTCEIAGVEFEQSIYTRKLEN